MDGVAGDIREILVIRRDLKMRRGKEIAQGSHAALAPFFDRMERIEGTNDYVVHMTPEMVVWKEGSFKKVVLAVSSEEDLLDLLDRAKEHGLPCRLITDLGHTEFHGVPTNTCISIGPARKEDLDPVTGGLPLY